MLPDGAFLYYYTHYFFYYTHYLSWLNRIAAPESTSYAPRFYAHPFCVKQQAYGTSGKLPLLSKVPKPLRLFAIILLYVTISAIIFPIIRIIPQPNVAFWLGIHCRLQPNCIIHHGRTVFAASSSGVDSIRYHKDVFSLNKADIGYTIHLSVLLM